MKYYKTTKHEEEMLQITTKLSHQNHSRLTKLKEWLNYKGVVINQQEVLNNLLEHCFSSTETAIQIDEDKFSYVEIINLIEQDVDTNKFFIDDISFDLFPDEENVELISGIEKPADELFKDTVPMSSQEMNELFEQLKLGSENNK